MPAQDFLNHHLEEIRIRFFGTPKTVIVGDRVQCKAIVSSHNGTQPMSWLFDRGWEGIPETFIISFVASATVIGIFTLLRFLAFRRRANVLTRPRKTWLHYIYGIRHMKPSREKVNAFSHDNILHSSCDSLLYPPIDPNELLCVDGSIALPGARPNLRLEAQLSRSPSQATSQWSNINLSNEHLNTVGSAAAAAGESGSKQKSHRTNTNGNLLGDDLDVRFNYMPSENQRETDISATHSDRGDEPANPAIDESNHQPLSNENGHTIQTADHNLHSCNSMIARRNLEEKRATGRHRTVTRSLFWFVDSFKLDDAEIRRKCGQDAYQYLLFERYIIYIVMMITFCALVIALPCNMAVRSWDRTNGTDDLGAFGRTTIASLKTYEVLWVHVILSLVIFLFSVFLMSRYSLQAKIHKEKRALRTLLIRRIPKSKRNKKMLSQFFAQLIGEGGRDPRDTRTPHPVSAIQFAYPISGFDAYETRYDTAFNAELYAEEYAAEYDTRMKVRRAICGGYSALFCCHHWGNLDCCQACRKVDAIEHYKSERVQAQENLREEYERLMKNPSGTVFVTFRDQKTAELVLRMIRSRHTCHWLKFPGCNWLSDCLASLYHCSVDSETTDPFQTQRWLVTFAPYPDDINWLDVSQEFTFSWARSIIVHLILLIVFFFLSTPAVALSLIDVLRVVPTLNEILPTDLNPLIEKYFPILFLLMMSSALPAIISAGMYYMPYTKKSQRNMAIMWKVYIFLIMMVMILPSLGLTSAGAAVVYITEQNLTFPWHCLFPVDNGAFFVNYVIQSSLIGNAMELLRITELLIYGFFMLIARSPAEYQFGRKFVQWDFMYGVRYPRLLLILVMVTSYSFSCPIIAPCGLLYAVIKHAVDRYNIYFVYTPSKISARIHRLAILFLFLAMLISQFQLFTFLYLQVGHSYLTYFSLIILIISTFSVFAIYFVSYLSRVRIIRRLVGLSETGGLETTDFCACAYVPDSIIHAWQLAIIGRSQQQTMSQSYSTSSQPEAQVISIPVPHLQAQQQQLLDNDNDNHNVDFDKNATEESPPTQAQSLPNGNLNRSVQITQPNQ